MVYIQDEGSEFDAPIDKVWKLAQSEAYHKHSFQKNQSVKMEGEAALLSFDTPTPDGRTIHQTIKITQVPPVGEILEYVEGDFAGTKAFNYYTPKGKKTGVTVVGEWVSKSIPADQLKKMVMKTRAVGSLRIAEGNGHRGGLPPLLLFSLSRRVF